MTKTELSELIGFTSVRSVEYAIEKSIENTNLVSSKKKNTFLTQDYTKEEIITICSFLTPPLNPLQLELVLDNFTTTGKKYINNAPVYKKGTERFIERYNHRKKDCKACGCCIYLIGKSYRTGSGKLYPFCAFFNRFTSTMKTTKYGKEREVDIFTDCCPSFVRGKPKVFEK